MSQTHTHADRDETPAVWDMKDEAMQSCKSIKAEYNARQNKIHMLPLIWACKLISALYRVSVCLISFTLEVI